MNCKNSFRHDYFMWFKNINQGRKIVKFIQFSTLNVGSNLKFALKNVVEK
jgi:hypothetical protein